MKNNNKKTLCTIAFILLLATSTMIASLSTATAQIPTRKTTAYLSVNPHLIGKDQPLTVNMWVYPSPATRTFTWYAQGFEDLTVTFTRPDGSKDTFMPVEGSGSLEPGVTETLGALWFLYYPNQVGDWSVQFSMPDQTVGTGDEAVLYPAATSQIVTFTVQSEVVQIGLPPASLPTGYWTRPINADYREWYQISGDWLWSNYDGGAMTGSNYNPYTTAPNAPHILWKLPVTTGGLTGGDWGGLSYLSSAQFSSIVVMAGKIYFNMPGGVFQCIDLRTGEVLWTQEGTINHGQHIRPLSRDPALSGAVETQATSPSAYLWQFTAASVVSATASGDATGMWIQRDAYSGAIVKTISNVPAGLNPLYMQWVDGDTVVYAVRQLGWNTTIKNRLAVSELIKWDASKVSNNNWTTGIVWTTSLKQPDGSGPGEGNRASGLLISNDRTVAMIFSTGEQTLYGFNLSTGTQIYKESVSHPLMSAGYERTPNDIHMSWDSAERRFHGYDIKTGKEVWVSEQIGEYPWGSQMHLYNTAIAYGNWYPSAYDGYVYAIDYTTGQLKWKYYAGNTTETVFGSWAPYTNGVVADGKFFIGTSEHTPTQPQIRGNKLICLDAYTGEHLWNISGNINTKAIVEGYYIGVNDNNGIMYCIGKGETETTVTAGPKTISKGSNVVIEGTVMDMSPASAGTPAIGDEYMSEWMNYLHMQAPEPMTTAKGDSWGTPVDVKGVLVQLTATAPDGTSINIGTTTSDRYGNFFYDWTPPSTGMYKIQATFAGSESYWSSTAQTAVSVTASSASPSVPSTPSTSTSAQTQAPTEPSPATSQSTSTSPSVAVAPPPSSGAPSMTLYIAIAAVAVVVVAVVVAVVLKRRK